MLNMVPAALLKQKNPFKQGAESILPLKSQ